MDKLSVIANVENERREFHIFLLSLGDDVKLNLGTGLYEPESVNLAWQAWLVRARMSAVASSENVPMLTLRQAAQQLQLSYSTVFEMRKQIGFRLPGSRVWRVDPARLKDLAGPDGKFTRKSEKHPISSKTLIPGPLSSRQASRELDALLAASQGKKKGS